MRIVIDTEKKARDLVSMASKYNEDIDMKFGRVTVDAKSILGVMSLGVSSSVKLIDIHSEDPEVVKRFQTDVEVFI